MFPPVDFADEDGLLAAGGDLKLSTLRCAYHSGIFPWPVEGLPLLWFAPPARAVLFLDEFHLSRSLRKTLRRDSFEIRFDCDFERVINHCAAPRDDDGGTWISPPMRAAYHRLHRAGEAHCVAAYCEGELAGGLYGVSWGNYFAGESMFFHRSGASKTCLIALVEHLRNRGATWIDIQMMTPLFESFGAREIERAQFMDLLEVALAQPARLFD